MLNHPATGVRLIGFAKEVFPVCVPDKKLCRLVIDVLALNQPEIGVRLMGLLSNGLLACVESRNP